MSIVPYIALSISIVALYFAVRNFLRKSGIYVKGQYSISSSIYAEDQYVNSYTIENFKDRSVILFKVLLRVGPNYYIELSNFEHEPKILKSYESFTQNLDPVDYYSVSMNRIKVNNLLSSKKVKTCLVLSTSHGKYVVKKRIQRWDPIADFFDNHLTVSIQAMRPNNKNGYYGADFSFLVKLSTEDGYVKTIAVYSEDYNYPRFEKFRLTKESLMSKSNLEEFLTEKAVNGQLNCINVEVIDGKELLSKSYASSFNKTIEAKHYSWFTYLVVGKLLTKFSNIRTYLINRKSRKANKVLKQN
ncbi:hypothetical protein EH243_18330 [Amphritea opalescens]|uniref:Uncharacterized protein n=1 Tax=Amphritea opalescens TaxID=2490544 RepID=A0A430KL89_9GAMM|nr:hypothetical protein [Amphritea opalescens]RTE64246.1 hypothetical protein EH243_18330 [Amphritea opalescens]